jgi:hypothetical protein
MSTRGFRARLDRLTRAANRANKQEKDHAYDITIDPALAKAIRDDEARLTVLVQKPHVPSKHGGGPLSAAEVEEQNMLRARMAERARAIGCPPGYGQKEYLTESNRLHKLHCKRMSPPSCGGGTLSDAEDAEEAQLTARVAAFRESPEGRARERIFELFIKEIGRRITTAEKNELDSLRTLYPNPPLDPNDPRKDSIEAWEAAIKKEEEEDRKWEEQRRTRKRTPHSGAGD